MQIGITGGGGFLGQALKQAIPQCIEPSGSLVDLAVARSFVRHCDRIYHLAGKNRDDPGKILANNLNATGNLVLGCILEEVDPDLVFASSTQVTTNPRQEYGFTKKIEEDIVKNVRRWQVVRIPNVYGPGGKPFYNSVIATFAWQIAHGEKPQLNDPEATREFIHVHEVVQELQRDLPNAVRSLHGEVLSIGTVLEYMTTRKGEHARIAECVDYYRRTHEIP